MSLLQWLGFGKSEDADSHSSSNADSVRKIVAELKALKPEQARYIAAFAFILSRVAYADNNVSDDEIKLIEELLRHYGELDEAQAVLAVEIARHQAILFGGTDNYIVTREFREMSTIEQRQQLLDCMFAVSAADDVVDSAEEATIRQISSELGFTSREFVDVRSKYNDKRAVVKLSRSV